MNENKGFSVNGYTMFAVFIFSIAVLVTFIIEQINSDQVNFLFFCPVIVAVFILPGFFMVQPNQAKVMTFFGSYVGTVKVNGLRWTIPLFMRKKHFITDS